MGTFAQLTLRSVACLAALLGSTSAGLAEPAVQDNYLKVDGVRLHYVRSGQGAPVVFLHGNDGTLQDFTGSIFYPLSSRYQCLAFDRPGHGKSRIGLGVADRPEDQAKVVHDALARLHISNPLLVAHSWSGAIALSYALQYPEEISAVVLLGSVAYESAEARPRPSYYAMQVPVVRNAVAWLGKRVGKRDVTRRLEEAFTPDPAPKEYVKAYLDRLFTVAELKAAAHDEIALNGALRRLSPNYGDIQVPLLIVTGDLDKTVPPSLHSQRLHDAVPHSELLVLHNAGHELQFTRPSEVISAIDHAEAIALSWKRPIAAQHLKALRFDPSLTITAMPW